MSKRTIHLTYGKAGLDISVNSANLQDVLLPKAVAGDRQEQVIREALENPVDSPTLRELTRDAKKIVILSNDNTRPMPSHLTIPLLVKHFFHPERYYDITILIATGLHRSMTDKEIEEKFGRQLTQQYSIVNHNARDDDSLEYYGTLSTGTPLYLNKLLSQSDLVISEGFIEAHFFAGYSGGRKSVVPGVAGAKTIMANHCPANIANSRAVSANLEENPVHLELLEAMRQSPLRFILNVVLDESKRVTAAFAGHPEAAHQQGCAYVREVMSVPCTPAPIVITSNNGYPLDRNMYQIIKGLDTAAKAALPGGILIMAAQCLDGVGHSEFYEIIRRSSTQEQLYADTCQGESEIDKWQVQVMARVLRNHQVILVSEGVDEQTASHFFFRYAPSVEQALEMAYRQKGRDAKVNVIPEGPVIIPCPAH